MNTYQQFIAKGVEQGIEKAKTEVILKGIEIGLSIDTLATITRISKERVIEIVNKSKL